MTEWHVLAYLSDPFDTEPAVFVVSSGDRTCREVPLDALSSYPFPLITYDPWRVVEVLRRKRLPIPSCLVDIGDALRLRSGLSKDQGGTRQWDVWSIAAQGFDSPADVEAMRSLTEARCVHPVRDELLRLLYATALALHRTWPTIDSDLQNRGEHARFFEVEVPIQQIFLSRQHAGIQCDVAALNRIRENVRIEKYNAYRKLASALGFAPDTLTFRNLGPFLRDTDARHLGEFGDGSLEEYLKIIREQSEFASTFLSYMGAKRHLSILTRMSCEESRLHPVFSCFGTVTGRILVRHPHLQQLRRQYRGIVFADKGKRLCYLDFAQFEPGILAERARDATFLDQYNSTDLYTTLSRTLFADEAHRGTCKRIFLSYCYGMSTDNIAKLLAGPHFDISVLCRIRDVVSTFFGAFPGLERYRQSLFEDLERKGFICTLMGNRRIRLSTGALTSKERRWAMSQAIQGSASLIFKQALLGLTKQFGRDSIVLPLHDAVLMQFDDGAIEEAESEAKSIMTATFETYCPSVRSKVVAGPFASDR